MRKGFLSAFLFGSEQAKNWRRRNPPSKSSLVRLHTKSILTQNGRQELPNGDSMSEQKREGTYIMPTSDMTSSLFSTFLRIYSQTHKKKRSFQTRRTSFLRTCSSFQSSAPAPCLATLLHREKHVLLEISDHDFIRAQEKGTGELFNFKEK